MGDTESVKIDAYSHISPPKYTEAIRKEYTGFYNQILGHVPPLFDMEARFRVMDKFGPIVQVLTVGPVPPLEGFADAKRAVELAKLANDEMAELVLKHKDRFLAAIALLPMNDVEAALKETDRAINELGFRGIYLHSNIDGKPLDAPEFRPFFQKMVEYDLPIYVHPWRSTEFADYSTESESKYAVASTFGWPYDTTVMMTRLVFSGILEKYPKLKVITHHLGGMVPYYEQRIVQHYGQVNLKYHDYDEIMKNLTKPPIEYYKMFYNDTAIHGNTPALMLAYHFWGAGHIVFGADMPLGDPNFGAGSYQKTINAIEAMDITDAEKKMIFTDNALKLLRMTL